MMPAPRSIVATWTSTLPSGSVRIFSLTAQRDVVSEAASMRPPQRELTDELVRQQLDEARVQQDAGAGTVERARDVRGLGRVLVVRVPHAQADGQANRRHERVGHGTEERDRAARAQRQQGQPRAETETLEHLVDCRRRGQPRLREARTALRTDDDDKERDERRAVANGAERDACAAESAQVEDKRLPGCSPMMTLWKMTPNSRMATPRISEAAADSGTLTSASSESLTFFSTSVCGTAPVLTTRARLPCSAAW